MRLTTSMPTPRPETSVTVSVVENPGANSSCVTASADGAWEGSTVVPSSRARFRTASASTPRPSSSTSITILPPVCLAEMRTVAVPGLPARTRSSGSASTPWSIALRTGSARESVMPSTTCLSSSISSPSRTHLTDFPDSRERSRTRRAMRRMVVRRATIRSEVAISWI